MEYGTFAGFLSWKSVPKEGQYLRKSWKIIKLNHVGLYMISFIFHPVPTSSFYPLVEKQTGNAIISHMPNRSFVLFNYLNETRLSGERENS